MSNVIPFQFESQAVRVQVDPAGEPWFNANDVCSTLGFGNPYQAVKSHVDTDDLQKLEGIDNLGRTQHVNHINESGLYALIMGSTKPEAKRFKHWVTSEVLPSLRREGHYQMGAANPSPISGLDVVAIAMNLDKTIRRVRSKRSAGVVAASLDVIEAQTGIGLDPYRKVLADPAFTARIPKRPAHEETVGGGKRTLPHDPGCKYNPTELGKVVGVSAADMNKLMERAGLQRRSNERLRRWELTPNGQRYAEVVSFTRNGLTGCQILWGAEVLFEIGASDSAESGSAELLDLFARH